jgi:pSer/pThr/pTyr-binding forkhead associated (FHA) protein
MVGYLVKVIFRKTSGDDDYAERVIQLKPGEWINVGRASSDTSKKMIASETGLWLTSPVISRRHARLDYCSNGAGVSISPF